MLLLAASVALFVAIPFFPMETNRKVDVPFLDTVDGRYMLLFFGFPGCSQVCPMVLGDLNAIYTDYGARYKKSALRVVFVNLMLEMDPDVADIYSKAFNQDFRGFHPTEKQLEKFKRTFGLLFSQADETGQMSHQGFTYLLRKEAGAWRLVKVMLKFPLNREAVLRELDRQRNRDQAA